MFSRITRSIIVGVILCGIYLRVDAMTTSVFTTGLSQPAKIAQTPLGNFLVTETLGPANSGRVSIIDRDGDRRTLIDGLPSGVGAEGPSGPTGLDMCGRTLFVAIGEGDGVLPGPIPGTQVPNPNPSSPLLSSVLEIHFSERVEKTTEGFTLTLANQTTLANNGLVVLSNGGGDWIAITKLVDFPNSVPNPIPPFPGNVRQSNPFALAADDTYVYVADGGMNHVAKVRISSSQWWVLATFPPRPNPLPFGPPTIEAVPDGIRLCGDELLVTLLTGFPFVQGLSEVRLVDTRTGRSRTFIGGRSSAIDVLVDHTNGLLPPIGPTGPSSEGLVQTRGRARYYVLEFSTNFLADEPGQLLRFQSQAFQFPGQLLPPVSLSGPSRVAGGLISPSGMARDWVTGDIFITEIFTGRIIRVHL